MSAERHQEHQERHEQAQADLEAARTQKLEELQHSQELAPEDHVERAEAAREAIHGHHEKQENAPTPEPEEMVDQAPTSRPMLSPKMNYVHTMATIRRQLSPVSQNFSKFIHTPVVEKTTEILENTVARPSVAIGATWTALIVGGVFYFVARHYGYMLSGSELIFSFIVGAFVGLLIEGLLFMFRGR
jgi:hypothetical protein